MNMYFGEINSLCKYYYHCYYWKDSFTVSKGASMSTTSANYDSLKLTISTIRNIIAVLPQTATTSKTLEVIPITQYYQTFHLQYCVL